MQNDIQKFVCIHFFYELISLASAARFVIPSLEYILERLFFTVISAILSSLAISTFVRP